MQPRQRNQTIQGAETEKYGAMTQLRLAKTEEIHIETYSRTISSIKNDTSPRTEPVPIQTGSRAYPASYAVGIGSLSRR